MACFYVMFMVLMATSNAASSNGVEIQIPDQCKDEGFCSIKPVGYQQLEEVMETALPDYLKSDSENRIGPETTSKRILSSESDWHNCPYIISTESAYLYNHGDNITKTDIIIQTKLFKQVITTVRCAYENIAKGNEECFQDLGVGAFGMKSTCKTNYGKRILYVYDIDKKDVIRKEYPFPVCCSCVVDFVDDIL